MRKLNPGDRLLIATHNGGKAKEIGDLLSPFVSSFTTSGALGLPEPEEVGASFEENALIKARQAARESGLVALADDSGLCVNALGGEPGIYSARWAGPNKDFKMAMSRINTLLSGCENRSAFFVCVLALAWPDGEAVTFEGRVNGQIAWPIRGSKGFGYDPFFVAEGYTQTFAEMEPKEKHSISHRAKAFKLLTDALSGGA